VIGDMDEAARALLVAGANLAVDAIAADAIATVHTAGVEPLVLKGPPLGRWLHVDETARGSGDVDLLVAPDDLERAQNALAAAGYERLASESSALDRPRHAELWLRPPSTISIDLHRTILGARAAPVVVWNALSRHGAAITLNCVRVRIPAGPARLLLVALHAAEHGAEEPSTTADLARALELSRVDDWEAVTALAAELDALPALVAGLELTPLGQRIAAKLGASTNPTIEVALRSSSAPHTALGFDWLARTPGLVARLRFLARKAVPPPGVVRGWSPLARRGRASLVAAYILRLVWLARWAVPGFRAWRRARRVTGATVRR
jgi:hypothetical protein